MSNERSRGGGGEGERERGGGREGGERRGEERRDQLLLAHLE